MKKIIISITTIVTLILLVLLFVEKRHKQISIPTSASQPSMEQTSTHRAQTKSSSSVKLDATEDIISEDYIVQRENVNLYGVITASRHYKGEQRPLVIISHGFNNTLEMNEAYAAHLARLGFIVYRFDFYGGSRQSKSGGRDMLSMSVLTEKQDLSAVVESLSKEAYVNADAISLLGISQGGVVSTLYAAENPTVVKNLILIFPAFVLFDDVKETYANLGVSTMEDIPEVITHRNAQLGSIYLKDALGVDIDSEIQKVTSPVLMIQGTNDDVVPYQYAVDAHQLFAFSELVTVEGGGHWIDSNFNQVALPAIEQFLEAPFRSPLE